MTRDEIIDATPPAFLLEAADPLAPGFVLMWACFVNGDLSGALDAFNSVAQSEAAEAYEDNPQEEAAAAAVQVAHDMAAWSVQ